MLNIVPRVRSILENRVSENREHVDIEKDISIEITIDWMPFDERIIEVDLYQLQIFDVSFDQSWFRWIYQLPFILGIKY